MASARTNTMAFGSNNNSNHGWRLIFPTIASHTQEWAERVLGVPAWFNNNTNSRNPLHSAPNVPYTQPPGQQLDLAANLLPLSRIPEDACVSIFSFLGAAELSSVRGASWGLLQTANSHGKVLWERLCRHDFPSVAWEAQEGVDPHQQYVSNVMNRATDEAGNLRATHRLRESLEHYSWTNKSKKRSNNKISGSGIIGLVSDLVTIADPRVARAVSHKRRAAMSTVVVTDVDVIYDFRRCGIYTGPINFLPLGTLQTGHTPAPLSAAAAIAAAVAAAAAGGGVDGNDREETPAALMLPDAPETPAPPGFLGYAVRLLRLRPEHEHLRWTVLFTLFKDLVVFETTEQAEAVRARSPHGALFYCALDHPGAQDDPCPLGGRALPHISHWGFRRPLVRGSGGGAMEGAAAAAWNEGATREMVGDAVERQERLACVARRSLAFLRYGGGGGGPERRL